MKEYLERMNEILKDKEQLEGMENEKKTIEDTIKKLEQELTSIRGSSIGKIKEIEIERRNEQLEAKKSEIEKFSKTIIGKIRKIKNRDEKICEERNEFL